MTAATAEVAAPAAERIQDRAIRDMRALPDSMRGSGADVRCGACGADLRCGRTGDGLAGVGSGHRRHVGSLAAGVACA
ncbi:hypothetical protein GCM10023324_47970 [Streptomyces youssoufiensis]